MSILTIAAVRKWFTPTAREETVSFKRHPTMNMDDIAAKMGRQVSETLEMSAFDAIRSGYQKVQERTRIGVFTVFEADNGYYATTRGGAVVVGETLSAVCDAAQAKVAEEKLLGKEASVQAAMYGSSVVRGLYDTVQSNTRCTFSTLPGSITGRFPKTLTRGERVDGQTDAQRKQGTHLFAQVHRSSV